MFSIKFETSIISKIRKLIFLINKWYDTKNVINEAVQIINCTGFTKIVLRHL